MRQCRIGKHFSKESVLSFLRQRLFMITLEPDSKGNYRASRLTAIWMQASVTKAARVRPRFS